MGETGLSESNFESHLADLLSICEQRTSGKSSTHAIRSLHRLLEQIAPLLQLHGVQMRKVLSWSSSFDSSLGVKANGFRSFARVSSLFIANLLEVVGRSQRLGEPQDLKELKECKSGLERLIDIFGFLEVIHELLRQGQLESEQKDGFNLPLFPSSPDIEEPSIERLCIQMALTDYSALYGRSLGFHYRGDARDMARRMLAGMATFADVHDSTSRLSNLLKSAFGLNYFFDSDALRERLESIKEKASVRFFQDFYNLPEMGIAVKYNHDRRNDVAVDQVLHIPIERLVVHDLKGRGVSVPLPTYKRSEKMKGVRARLIAPFRTAESFGKCTCIAANLLARSLCRCRVAVASKSIFFHVHGGGFISQSSRSHLTYLRQWSKKLNVPILSIDYTLAPDACFPTACEEVFYAYCWMLNHFDVLASSGSRLVIGGDSAGGNLCFGLIAKIVQFNLRMPNHLAAFYPSVLNQMYPSPSRLLALFDPFLMFPALIRCMNAYADPNYLDNGHRTFHQELEMLTKSLDPLMSPLLLSSSVLKLFPPTTIVTTDVDPCLDESVSMASRLNDNGVHVDLDVLTGLPHGFLGMRRLSKECQMATEQVTDKLKVIFDNLDIKQ